MYRWRVNTLLTEQDTDLELAETGKDRGLLVHRTSDGRQQLFDQARLHVVDGNHDRIEHAITLFRRRTASLEDKRSACKDLADVLENRRPFIKANFHGKDAGVLFDIANSFGIRHHDGKQRLDYPEEYLDWTFWWYLATIDLTNRL